MHRDLGWRRYNTSSFAACRSPAPIYSCCGWGEIMRLGRLGLPGLLFALASLAASYRPSLAYEPQFAVNTTPGVTTGLLLGANPPPGVYFLNLGYVGQSKFVGGGA